MIWALHEELHGCHMRLLSINHIRFLGQISGFIITHVYTCMFTKRHFDHGVFCRYHVFQCLLVKLFQCLLVKFIHNWSKVTRRLLWLPKNIQRKTVKLQKFHQTCLARTGLHEKLHVCHMRPLCISYGMTNQSLC